jgi:hypothetical protein
VIYVIHVVIQCDDGRERIYSRIRRQENRIWEESEKKKASNG